MKCFKRKYRSSLLHAGSIAMILGLSTAPRSFGQVASKPAESAAKPSIAASAAGASLVYNPPKRGAPRGTIGGGTRGGNRSVVLALLTPEHVGLTTKEQPTLYWYISQPTESLIELTIVESKQAKPLLEINITPPSQAGIQRIRLADYNVQLRTGGEYRWYVAMVPDPKNRSKDIIAGAFIERIEPSDALRKRLSQAAQPDAASAYAAEGVWYDALAAISDAIDGASGDNNLHARRAALLEQVNLQQVANFDRAR